MNSGGVGETLCRTTMLNWAVSKMLFKQVRQTRKNLYRESIGRIFTSANVGGRHIC